VYVNTFLKNFSKLLFADQEIDFIGQEGLRLIGITVNKPQILRQLFIQDDTAYRRFR